MSSAKSKTGLPRDHVLWHANDLFGPHHGVACPTCGVPVRDSSGEKRAQRLRHMILHLFTENVPVEFDPRDAVGSCSGFVTELKQLAHHALGDTSADFVELRMQRYLEKMQRDHQAG